MRTPMRLLLLLTAALAAPLPSMAQEPAPDAAPPETVPEGAIAPPDAETGLAPAPEPPDIPQQVQSGEALEPEVTIIQREQETVEEYRINGQLYMIKITPSAGPPYYLIDVKGDGNFERRGNDIVSETYVPQWVLFSW